MQTDVYKLLLVLDFRVEEGRWNLRPVERLTASKKLRVHREYVLIPQHRYEVYLYVYGILVQSWVACVCLMLVTYGEKNSSHSKMHNGFIMYSVLMSTKKCTYTPNSVKKIMVSVHC